MKVGKKNKENEQPVIKIDIFFDLRDDTVNIFCVLENCPLRTFGNACLRGLRRSYVIYDKEKSSIFLLCTLMGFSCS